jgi:hypothetical protein
MHFFSKEKFFFGGHGIVGGQIGLGAGIAFAEQYKMGIQQAAREIRYAWFESLIKEMELQATSKIVFHPKFVM